MSGRCTVGLVADPDVPQTVAEWLADQLPQALRDDREWAVQVEVDPVAAGQHDVHGILRALARQTARHDWDYAICLTDLPVRRDGRPVLAEINRDEGIAVVALPALGGLQPRRRARQLVVQVLEELTASSERVEQQEGASRRGLQSTPTRLLAPVERAETATERGGVDVRYHATRRRGRLRLLSGMVRTNRPWRLIFGMSSALAAAVATSAFGLSSSTIWQIGYELDPVREVLAALVSVGVLVLWLVTAHHLWETPSSTGAAGDRDQIRLYNISTVATLTIGVGVLYLGLFVINVAVAAFLVPYAVLTSTLGSAVGPGTYVTLAWGFTTMGVVAGALGSSLESDRAVRQAAYGYREQQRRAEWHRDEGDGDVAHGDGVTADGYGYGQRHSERRLNERPLEDRPMTAVREVMTAGAECVHTDQTAADAARLMDRLGVGALPICGPDDKIKGVVTDRDLVTKVIAQSREAGSFPAGDLNQEEAATIGADDDVQQALQTMTRLGVRRLPVIDQSRLVGMLAVGDIAKALPDTRLGDLGTVVGAR